MKIVIILLLLVVVTGTTYDAYAQTNSERIRTIESTTSDIKSIVDDIAVSLAPVSDMIEKLDSILLSSTTITSELSEIKSSISGFNSAFLTIQTAVESNKNQLNGLTAQMLEMNTKIDSIQTTINSDDNSEIERSIDLLKATIDNNSLALNARLDAIATGLRSVEQKLEAPTQTLNNPVRKTLSQDVTSYDYKISGSQRTISGNTVYFLDMRFSCNGPVSIDSVSTSVRAPQPPIIPTSVPNSATPENYLKVDERDLYNSKYEVSLGNFVVQNKGAEFNLRPLPTGTSLDFTSRQTEDGTRISSSTPSSFAFSYTIEVVYLGSSSTRCSLDVGRGGGSNSALSHTGTLTLSISTPPSTDKIQNPFSQTVSCGGNPVQITGISGQALSGGGATWNSDLATFARFNLEFPGNPTSNTEIGFTSDGRIASSTYPISFSNSDIIVKGNIPIVNQLLVNVDYSTVTGGSCK